ncbi:MAG: HU family DNA-binding protein [Phycisphaeraceae bacterium]
MFATVHHQESLAMATVTKKQLIDQIADATGEKRIVVKAVVQSFLDSIIVELGKGNRLEFRDFGVFEVKQRRARKAQNPKTLDPVWVGPKRTVKFKVGRLMKESLGNDEMVGGLDDLDTIEVSLDDE